MYEPYEPDADEEPECLQEFSSMSAEECQVARDIREELLQRFSAEVLVYERDGRPNKVNIWAHTQDDLDRATDHYIRACGNDPNP